MRVERIDPLLAVLGVAPACLVRLDEGVPAVLERLGLRVCELGGLQSVALRLDWVGACPQAVAQLGSFLARFRQRNVSESPQALVTQLASDAVPVAKHPSPRSFGANGEIEPIAVVVQPFGEGIEMFGDELAHGLRPYFSPYKIGRSLADVNGN